MKPFKHDAQIHCWLLLVLSLLGRQGFSVHAAGPEPAGWYAGDMHVHRSCGGSRDSVSSIYNQMTNQDLAVLSLLADMGNDAIDIPGTPSDLPNVTGKNDPISTAGHILHWDTEWHWDPDDYQRDPVLYPHEALGGHIVALGLTNAYQIWAEYTYPIFQWAHQQGGIAGFAHLQYLGDGFPLTLTCCTPIEYPVEVALGACDFVSEDVAGGDTAIHAYYRLLNCGFRPGFAGGSDYPCDSSIGQTLTYVQIPGGQLTYSNWIRGIAKGRTVVSRDGHNEFLDLKVNGTAGPGDEIQLTNAGSVQVAIQWTAQTSLSGTIELVKNGVVVSSLQASATPGTPATLSTNVGFTNSGWLCARRMSGGEHAVNTAAVFVTVNHAPVRASVDDAQFYVQWMDNLLALTSLGGDWSSFFVTNRAEAQARYSAAKAVYQQIALEAAALLPVNIDTAVLPYGTVNTAYSTTLAASDEVPPYTWSLTSGLLPTGLALNTNSGAITGTPNSPGIFNFTVQVSDASHPVQTATKPLNITITTVPLATIWPSSTVPGVVDGGLDNPVELGVKFRSDVAGSITAIRFYKATANTGTHVGNLWSTNGTLLATATFTGETSSGWQQVNFASPVPISANTIYIASYYANNGHYSDDENYFSTSGVDNPPLHALANGAAGGDGVYIYGATSAFPTNTYHSANYWVDVVLVTNTAPVLPVQTKRTIAELSTLTVTNTATDANVLSYQLVNPPAGAVIDPNGVITWTPTEAQGPSTNIIKTVVTDNGVPPLSATNNLTVTVNEVNVAPTLPNQNNLTTSGLTPVVVTNTASDTDIPVNGLGYQLTGSPPAGAGIDLNGMIRWTPTVGEVPGVYTLTTVVTDTNVYAVNAQDLSATNSFTVTVNAIHNVPGLGGQGNRTNNEQVLLVVTNTASDNDVPPLALSYTLAVTNVLDNSVVTNAAISTNGVITWTPTEAQGPSTNRVTTVVSDGTYSASNSFVVTVNEVNVAPTLPSQTNLTNSGLTAVVVTNTASDTDIPVNGLGYQLTGSPPLGSSIDTSGVIRWTPAVNQVPGVYTFTTVVTDTNVYAVNAQNLSATNSFTVTEQAIHNGPGLGGRNNVTNNELVLMTVTNMASDSDVPPLALSYTLAVTNVLDKSAVTNAAISTNGVITWTPTEAQGPSTNVFTTVVSDGSLSATNTFTVTVNEVNVAPTLPNQNNLTNSGLTAVVVTNTASDTDIPVNGLGYQLTGSPPAGAGIDSNGVIRWTPTVNQVPGVYTFTTVVTDTNVYAVNAQDLSATNSFTVTVNAIHNGPGLGGQGNRTNNEQVLLVVTNTATDNDIPALPLTYSLAVTNLLDNSAVTNAAISTNGVITWTPTEAQGPSTNRVTTVVSDGTYSASNSFVVTVNEVNTAPVLPVQSNRTIDVLTTLIITNTATDSDIPANTLTYMLAVAPTNALIDSNGVITWTPVSAQVGTTNLFITVVTDDGLPPLSATNSFEVIINPAPIIPPPLTESISLSNGVVTVTWSSVFNQTYRLQYIEDLSATNWVDVMPDVQATGPIATATNIIGASTQRFYRVLLMPLP